MSKFRKYLEETEINEGELKMSMDDGSSVIFRVAPEVPYSKGEAGKVSKKISSLVKQHIQSKPDVKVSKIIIDIV